MARLRMACEHLVTGLSPNKFEPQSPTNPAPPIEFIFTCVCRSCEDWNRNSRARSGLQHVRSAALFTGAWGEGEDGAAAVML